MILSVLYSILRLLIGRSWLAEVFAGFLVGVHLFVMQAANIVRGGFRLCHVVAVPASGAVAANEFDADVGLPVFGEVDFFVGVHGLKY